MKRVSLDRDPFYLNWARMVFLADWQAADRRYFSLESIRDLTHPEILMEDLGPLRLVPIH